MIFEPPRMVAWRDRSKWSVAHDCEMCRVSGYDQNNQEFWKEIETGKGFRDRRAQAVFEIQDAIQSVDDNGQTINKPGEVK